ncbi:MAG: GNAT family N-acetyltransferase [Cyanobacteria bacterium J06623_5]
MIRNADISDRSAIKAITEAVGFEPAEVETVLSSFDKSFKERTASAALWLVDDDGGIQGLAYVEPEQMTEGTYNLLLLAVHPSRQKQGRGANLVKQVERAVAEKGGRILLIETMATEEFSHVRRLYERLGLEKEAQIRDFYAEGYDKVVFWKAVGKT